MNVRLLFYVLTGCVIAVYAQTPFLGLPEALRMGEEQNLGLQAQNGQERLVRYQLESAQANLWPTLTLNSDLSRPGPNLRGDDWLNAASRSQYETVWRSNLAFKWVLFDGMGNWAGVEMAQLSAKAASARTQAELWNVRSLIASAYWEVSRQQELGVLRRQNLERSQDVLRIAQAKRGLGVANLLEVRQAELDRNADSSAWLKQQLALRQAQRQMNALLERDLEVEFRVDSVAVIDTALNQEQLQASMERNHPALMAGKMNEEASAVNVQAVRSDWLPEVALYANYQFLEQYAEQNPPNDVHRQGMLYGAQLTFPLFEGGRTRSKVASAKETRELARLSSRQVRSALGKTLSLGYANYRQSVQIWRMESYNASQADSTYQLGLAQYKLGALSALEMRRLQETGAEAASRATQALYDAKQAEEALRSLTGAM